MICVGLKYFENISLYLTNPSLSHIIIPVNTSTIWFLWKVRCRVVLEYVCVCVCVRAQSCPTLCDPVDCRPPGSSVHGIFKARILEQVAISYSSGPSCPRMEPESPALTDGLFSAVPPGKPIGVQGLQVKAGQSKSEAQACP